MTLDWMANRLTMCAATRVPALLRRHGLKAQSSEKTLFRPRYLSHECQHAQSKSGTELAKRSKDEIEKVTACEIVEWEGVSENEVILTRHALGENATTRFKLHRIGNEWKIANPVKGDGSDAK